MNVQKKPCSCDICKRSRIFKKHLKQIKDPEAIEWFENFFGYVYELEEDLCAYEIYQKNLKTLYPRIWKEVTTIQSLSKDEAEFPEKQL